MHVHLIAKAVKTTQFMQHCDVFEKFKFAGNILTLEVGGFEGEKMPTLRELFDGLRQQGTTDHYETVGMVIPGRGALVLAGHKVFCKEDGSGWTPIEMLVKQLGCDTYEEIT